MNFQEYLNGIDDFDKISRRIWADMKGEKPITNSINPYYTNLWVDEEKLFKLLRSSTDFNTYVFDAQKDFISSSQEVEKVSFKEIPPPKIDNTRVKTKMTEKLIIQKPKIEDLKFQDTLFDRVDGKVWVNISQGYIDPQKYTHHTHLNIRKREIQCIINIPFREYSRRTSTAINEVEMTVDNSSDTPDAIQIKLSDAEDYMDVITYLFPYHKEMAQVALVNHFEEAGRGLTSIDDLMFFYNHLPTFALNGVDYKGKTKKLSDELLWEHFLQFLKYDSQLLKDVNTVGKAAALVVEPFRDKSCYAIRILMAISGEFVYTKLKNNSTLIFQIYHSLDGESVYLGNGVISEINQVKYGEGVNNRDLFVTYVTAFMQAKHAMDDEHQPQKKGCVFLFGTKKISDIIEKYYELNGNFMEGDPDNNFADVDKITLINTAKDWNVKNHEFDDEVEVEHDAFRPLDMLHLKVYEKVQDQYLETDTEVPALFLYHLAQQRALKDALRCLRITADLVVIGVSALTIASGVSGMPLYVAVADLGFALSDTYIESQLRDELEMTSKGRELLDVWDNVFMVQGNTSIMAGMLPKAGGALVKSTEVMYTSRTYSSQQKNLQTLIKNTLYSFPLRGFSKNGLKVLLKDGIKSITHHSSTFEKLNVLFVENADKEVAVLYKGKKFFHGSLEETNSYIKRIFRKVKNDKQLEEYLDNIIRLEEFGKNLNAVRLTELELEEWIQIIRRLGAEVKFYTESKKMVKYFKSRNVGACFDGWDIPPTIWIRKDVTDLEMFHECMHFEDYLRRGRRNYLTGEQIIDIPKNRALLEHEKLLLTRRIPEKDRLISTYVKEKYVYDKIVEEQNKWLDLYGHGRFSPQDMRLSKANIDDAINACKAAGIDVNKITIK